MTAPLCTRCRSEPAVQGSELGVRCLWPERALTRADLDTLPDGAVVEVTWSGGNGPHVYQFRRGPGGVPMARTYGHPGDPPEGILVGVLVDIGDAAPFTVVRIVKRPETPEPSPRPEPPCAARIGEWWCVREEGHAGMCRAATGRAVRR